jgi:hypothetical protein
MDNSFPNQAPDADKTNPRVLHAAAAPGPITLRGAFRTAAMMVHRETGKVVFSQNTRLWFRAVVIFWALVTLAFPIMIYSEIFTTQTTRFTCDRSSNKCLLDGLPRDVPPLNALKRAMLSHSYNGRDGPNYGIDLITVDGKRVAIDTQRAIKQSTIDNYKASVNGINAFLADPGRPTLDTSFTYVAGLEEILKSIFFLAFGIVTTLLLFGLWVRRKFTFEPGGVTLISRHPFKHSKYEIPAYRISAIVDHPTFKRRLVELKLDDGISIPVVETWRADSVSDIANELSHILAKPLETLS